MSNRPDDSYDPYIPSGGNANDSPFSARTGGPSSATSFNNANRDINDKDGQGSQINRLQAEISGAVRTMQDNIAQTSERGGRIEDMAQKSDRLYEQSNSFKNTSNGLRKKMWQKNMRMKIIIGVGIALILLVIILGSVLGSR